MLAPKAMPHDVIREVNSAVVEALRAPKVKQILVSAGAEAASTTPDEFARFLQSEMVKWAKVVKAAASP